MTVEIVCADARDALAAMPAGSVHTCVTSPPYWGLRDYGIGPDAIGLEPTPELYVEHIVQVMREVRRVLRDDGTLWLNLGDSYAGSGKGLYGDGTSHGTDGVKQKTNAGSVGLPSYRRDRRPREDDPHKSVPGLKPKDLCGMPWRVAFALQADGWWLRSDIVWSKPNPMPESVTDRPTRSHEYVFLLSKSARYYYDQDAIREPVTGNAHARGDGVNPKAKAWPRGWDGGEGVHMKRNGRYPRPKQNESFSAAVNELVSSRNRRSVWEIATQAYAKAHFATFPEKLVEPCILAGCPEGGTALDPFAGSGTVGLVAERLGRHSVLIDANEDYCAMARERTAQRGLIPEAAS